MEDVSASTSRPLSSSSWSSAASTFLEQPAPGWHFQYYLPHISNSSADFYTSQDWVAYDMREASEQVETETLIAGDLDLPFIHEDDFNYYPATADELSCASGFSTDTDESLLAGRRLKRTKLAKKKEWEEFWLERAFVRMMAKLRLRK